MIITWRGRGYGWASTKCKYMVGIIAACAKLRLAQIFVNISCFISKQYKEDAVVLVSPKSRPLLYSATARLPR